MKELGELKIFCHGTCYFKCNPEEFRLSQIVKLLEIDKLTNPELFTITFQIQCFFTNHVQLAELFFILQKTKGTPNNKNFIGPI